MMAANGTKAKRGTKATRVPNSAGENLGKETDDNKVGETEGQDSEEGQSDQ
jgi:hypothetical protein